MNRGYRDGPGPRGPGFYGPPGMGPPGGMMRGGMMGGGMMGRGMGMGMGPPMQKELPPKVEVDRMKTCPLLLRVFPCNGKHHRLEDYAKRGEEPEGEVQIYTWPDATLRELSELVREARTEARLPRARLSFAFVYPDRFGHNVMKQVGIVAMTRPNGPDDHKSLAQLGFQTGDFLDVAIQT